MSSAHEETVGRLERNEPLTSRDEQTLEAIILPNERPVVDVVGGTYTAPPAPFAHLGEDKARKQIEPAIPSIGRIELPDRPQIPYGGTGFVVGDNLLMTNRHVAELFAEGLGREELSFIPGQSAGVDFLRERDRPETREFGIERIAMVHPYWDMALLVVDGLSGVTPLALSVKAPAELENNDVVVIGYPALDHRNNVEVQNKVFGGVFNVKRLQPGMLRRVGKRLELRPRGRGGHARQLHPRRELGLRGDRRSNRARSWRSTSRAATSRPTSRCRPTSWRSTRASSSRR